LISTYHPRMDGQLDMTILSLEDLLRACQITRRIYPVAYEVTLPSSLENLHNVSYVLQLRKCIIDPLCN